MDAIGGYFSLELPVREEYHKDAIRLNTGRNCLEYILRVRNYQKVYIPYYTCAVILEPFQKLSVTYEFYRVDIQLELAQDINLNDGEALLYTNYFGLKQRYVEKLAEKFGRQLIVDNTQAFYAKPLQGIDTFYTCRKFFGVADGACLYSEAILDDSLEQDESYDRMAHLMKRVDLSAEQGFQDFRKADDGLDNQPIRKMSKLTQRIMQSIDYETAAQKRRDNYQFLHKALSDQNNLELKLDEDAVPMIYPYLTNKVGMQQYLISNKIFVAKYWPNVIQWAGKNSMESRLTNYLMPLPIDQRYGEEEMNYIVDKIKEV